VEEILAELRGRGVRYGAGRTMLAQRLAHTVLVRMENDGDSPDDRVQDAVARSRPVRTYEVVEGDGSVTEYLNGMVGDVLVM